MAERTRMKAILLGLVLGIAGLPVQAQRGPNPAQSEQSLYTPVPTGKIRELVCREQAARDMQKPVALPSGTTRAWELERVQRVRLYLAKDAEPKGIAGVPVQAPSGLNTAPAARSLYTPVPTEKMRELVCRERAAREMQKPVVLPPGATRAWELERDQRERLCLAQATRDQ